MLDFTPNAAHAGIYAALARAIPAARGSTSRSGRRRAPPTRRSSSPPAARDFAILDVHDLAIARRRGLPLVGVAPIVDRPLASVIARDRSQVRTPADLAGKTVGVTGLPSDNAVLD